jgi:hypothetical protein
MATDMEYLYVNIPIIESKLQSEDSNNITSLSEGVVRIQTLRNWPYIYMPNRWASEFCNQRIRRSRIEYSKHHSSFNINMYSQICKFLALSADSDCRTEWTLLCAHYARRLFFMAYSLMRVYISNWVNIFLYFGRKTLFSTPWYKMYVYVRQRSQHFLTHIAPKTSFSTV